MDTILIQHQLLYFSLLILSALFMGKLFHRLGVGEITGQILGGVLVSPYLLTKLNILTIEHQA
ncbi:MAG: hypothetical protein KAI63_04690, partial [Planctomycetes bacterium]|nr:hypothetical protein [Planctomycetota bacterium]